MNREAREEEVTTKAPLFAYDATVSMRLANVVAFLLLITAYLLFVLPFPALWERPLLPPADDFSLTTFFWLALLFLLSIAAHELIHAVTFLLFGKVPVAAIKFGFSWKAAAPYAHCRVPVSARTYRLAVALPGLLLGLAPGVAGLLVGSGWLAIWGTFMTAAAGGDLAVLWAVRAVPRDRLVLDHPTEPGCQVLAEEEPGLGDLP